MVKKAKKKPVEVEFIQYKGTKNKKEVFNWTNGKVHDFYDEVNFDILLGIDTLEGVLVVSENDYVVKGVQGEFYAVKPDIFKQTYDILENNKYKENDISEIKEKAKAFDEILDINIDKDELLSEEYIEKVNDVIQEWIFS
ncbi:MAG: hypothetical protein E6618_09395 [Staphylococcus warneri]|nr:hypothetical protein [Staphylococcus lugdunensis]MDU6254406.1 hypothetical protein [Staphylococcus warneri]